MPTTEEEQKEIPPKPFVQPELITMLPRQELVTDIDGYQFLDLCKRESIAKEIRINRIDVGSSNALYTVLYTVLPKPQECAE